MAENNSSAPLKTAGGNDLAIDIAEHTAEADAICRKLYNQYGHEQTVKNAREWIQIAKQLLDDALQAAAPQAVPAAVADWEEAARTMSVKIAQNCNSVPQLVFPFLYLGLKELFATPALPATEDSSAGELVRHGMTPRDQATQDQIASVMLQHGTPEQQAQALAYAGWQLMPTNPTAEIIYAAIQASCNKVTPESIKDFIAAYKAQLKVAATLTSPASDMQADPVARDQSVWCEYVAGIVATYVGFKTGETATDDRIKAIAGIIERRLMFLAAPHAQPADALDAAFEAVRKRFCKLPRYSFLLDGKGNVRRVPSFTGNWVEFEAAHTLFDPVAVDAVVAAAQEGGDAAKEA